jgi:hypothetical protein
MIIATHGIVASAAGFIPDADAQAFFDRVTTAGGSLSATEKTAVNQLVLDLKGYSIWTKMKAIYPMVGASAAACAQNLKSSSFTGSFSGGWTYASTGVTPNGTSAYMDTGFNPNSQSLSTTSAHNSLYQRQDSVAGTSMAKMGAAFDLNIVNGIGLGLFSSGSREVGIIACSGGTEYAPSGTSAATKGFFLINTNSNRNAQHWISGSKNGATVTQSGNMPNRNIYIGATNTGSSTLYYFNREIALSSIGDGLTDTQASNLDTAVQAFQTTLSRNV